MANAERFGNRLGLEAKKQGVEEVWNQFALVSGRVEGAARRFVGQRMKGGWGETGAGECAVHFGFAEQGRVWGLGRFLGTVMDGKIVHHNPGAYP